MEIKRYDTLTESAIKIRQDVFMKEQGFQNEFDETDQTAKHFVAFDGDRGVGTCRVYYDAKREAYMLGRLAVDSEYRGQHIGEQLIAAAETYIKEKMGNCCMLTAQVKASGFYEKQGYHKQGEEFLDEFCPHVLMVKELR